MRKQGVLLVNLGTPDKPEKAAVRSYLREFLMDKRVINLPWLFRFVLVYLIIVPKRLDTVTELYKKIWQDDSPIRTILKSQVLALEQQLNFSNTNCEYYLEPAMTYGQPSISSAIENLTKKGVKNLIVLPLYPQFSKTTTIPVLERVKKAFDEQSFEGEYTCVEHYFDHPLYIEALTEQIKEQNQKSPIKHLLLSYHGIPKSYVDAGDPYYEQCQATTALIKSSLSNLEIQISESFQSRVTSEEWIGPYTEDKILQMQQEGIKELYVMCPGFSADCLETIDEVAQEYKKLFLEAGGKHYYTFPALNVREKHISMMKQLIVSSVTV